MKSGLFFACRVADTATIFAHSSMEPILPTIDILFYNTDLVVGGNTEFIAFSYCKRTINGIIGIVPSDVKSKSIEKTSETKRSPLMLDVGGGINMLGFSAGTGNI